MIGIVRFVSWFRSTVESLVTESGQKLNTAVQERLECERRISDLTEELGQSRSLIHDHRTPRSLSFQTQNNLADRKTEGRGSTRLHARSKRRSDEIFGRKRPTGDSIIDHALQRDGYSWNSRAVFLGSFRHIFVCKWPQTLKILQNTVHEATRSKLEAEHRVAELVDRLGETRCVWSHLLWLTA